MTDPLRLSVMAVARAAVAPARGALAVNMVRRAEAQVVKGWREQHPPTEHARFDVRIVDHWAPKIARALLRLWTHEQLRIVVVTARQFVPMTKASAADPHGLVASVVEGQLRLTDPDLTPLQDALRGVWADAWVTGAYVGAMQTAGQAPGAIGAYVNGIDWDTWKPGNPAAALQVADGGLASLLSDAGITIRGVTDTTITRIGNTIAQGLAAGDSIDRIGRALTGTVGSQSRALMIAHTETARAMTQATLGVYSAGGAIRQWDWLTTSGACKVCLAAESANPHDLTDPNTPPGHPMCRCAVAPVIPLGGVDIPTGSGADLGGDLGGLLTSGGEAEAAEAGQTVAVGTDLTAGMTEKDAAEILSAAGGGDGTDDYADYVLRVLWDRQGFSGAPRVVDEAEFEDAATGKLQLYRGLEGHGETTSADYAEQFRAGEAFPGQGVYGSGTYTSPDRNIAIGYSDAPSYGTPGADGRYLTPSLEAPSPAILRMAVDEANLVNARELKAEHVAFLADPDVPDAVKALLKDRGRYAAARGYDGYYVDRAGSPYVIVQNRTALIVQATHG